MSKFIQVAKTVDGDPVYAPIDESEELPRLELVAELPTEGFNRLAKFVPKAGRVERTCDETGPVIRVYAEAA